MGWLEASPHVEVRDSEVQTTRLAMLDSGSAQAEFAYVPAADVMTVARSTGAVPFSPHYWMNEAFAEYVAGVFHFDGTDPSGATVLTHFDLAAVIAIRGTIRLPDFLRGG